MKKFFFPLVTLVLLALAPCVSAADKLTIRKLVFVEDIQGLGNYTPRGNAGFTLDDTCTVYIEAEGFAMSLTPGAQDEYNMDLAVDVAIKLPESRRTLFSQSDVTALTNKVRSELPVYLAFSFTFNGFMPGNYILEVGLRDNIGGQIMSQDLIIQVTEP